MTQDAFLDLGFALIWKLRSVALQLTANNKGDYQIEQIEWKRSFNLPRLKYLQYRKFDCQLRKKYSDFCKDVIHAYTNFTIESGAKISTRSLKKLSLIQVIFTRNTRIFRLREPNITAIQYCQ